MPSSGNSTRIYKRKCKEPVKNETASLKNGTAPHHLALQGAGCRSCLKRQFGKKSPPRGSREAADNFCLIVRKHDEARGSLGTRQGFTFLPKKMKFTEFFFRQGEGLERGGNLNRPLSSAYADTFPATVGFFALFSLRRKSEKGESKDKAADARHFPRRGKQGGGSAPMWKARGVSTL